MTRMFFHLCLAVVFISATSCSIFESEDESVAASEIEGELEGEIDNIEIESAASDGEVDDDESFEDLDIENASTNAKADDGATASASDNSFGDIENFNDEQIGTELSDENIANSNSAGNEIPLDPTADADDLDLEAADLEAADLDVPDLEVADLEPQPETTTVTAAATTTPSSSGNKITNLEYKSQESGGSVVISATEPFTYQVRDEPEFNQTIIEIADVELPDRFKLPYIAKDFEQAVATVNAYQDGGSSTARFVIQYKDKLKPGVSMVGNKLLVTNSGISTTTVVASKSQPLVSGKKLSLEMQDINIKDLIYYIADEVGVNIIVDDNVTGTANVKLKDVPWEEALSIILRTNGLAYERRGEILRVAKIESITNEFTAETKRLEAQDAAMRSSQSRAVKVIPINYANLEELAVQIKPFLTATGNVMVDKRSSSVILNDFDGPLKRAEKLIKSLDIQPIQVQIEGKIIEAGEQFSREYGFQWGQNNGQSQSGSQIATFSNNIRADRNLNNVPGGFVTDFTFGTIETIGDLSARMSIYEREQKIKVLSSPKIVTLNKEKAIIESTQPVPIFTTVFTQGVGSQNQVAFTDAKLSLEVTPQVSFNSDLILDIAVSRDIPGPAVGTPASRGLSKRNARTKVIVKDGHSLVLGGIFSQDETATEGGVPLLKDIPVLGYLFKTKTKEVSKTELVIFLTPKILNTENMLRTTEISSTGEVVQSPNETSSPDAKDSSSVELDSEVESL